MLVSVALTLSTVLGIVDLAITTPYTKDTVAAPCAPIIEGDLLRLGRLLAAGKPFLQHRFFQCSGPGPDFKSRSDWAAGTVPTNQAAALLATPNVRGPSGGCVDLRPFWWFSFGFQQFPFFGGDGRADDWASPPLQTKS